MIDRIYIAASTYDAAFTRICVASVRRLYPELAVQLLPGGPLNASMIREMSRHWDVSVAPVPIGDYGWGFVKLEPLFGRAGERFLVLDSDTAVAGRVVERGADDAPFTFDRETQTDEDTRRLYYDWAAVRAVDGHAQPPRFVANTGQWFGTAGVLTRSDFEPWIDWSMPRRVRHPQIFRQGEQGLLNYVLNRELDHGRLHVALERIMRWPAHGMSDITAASIARDQAPSVVVHWAGLKRSRRADMPGADVLEYFERIYYSRLGLGGARRALLSSARSVRGNLRHVVDRLVMLRHAAEAPR